MKMSEDELGYNGLSVSPALCKHFSLPLRFMHRSGDLQCSLCISEKWSPIPRVSNDLSGHTLHISLETDVRMLIFVRLKNQRCIKKILKPSFSMVLLVIMLYKPN
jgi:hypothetical protein